MTGLARLLEVPGWKDHLGLPVGVDGNVTLLFLQLLAHGADLSLKAIHAALEASGDIKGLLVLAPSLVSLVRKNMET